MSNKRTRTHASGPKKPWRSASLVAVYESHRRYLLRRAEAQLRDAEEARDVVQETFLGFMRMQPALQGEATDSTVLQGILQKQINYRLRRRSRGGGRMGALELGEEEDSLNQWEAATSHDGGMGGVEALKDLVTLTRGETSQALTVAYLYLLENRSFEEIGKELCLGRKVVSQLLQKLVGRVLRRRARLALGGHS